MKDSLFKKNLKELFGSEFKHRLSVWYGICTTLYGAAAVFFEESIKKYDMFENKLNILIFILIIFGCGMIIIWGYGIWELFKKEFEIKVKNYKHKKIIIKIGNYEDNMDKILNELKSSDKEAIFVIGINDEINMSRAQRRGVHKGVLDKFYSDEEKCEVLQAEVYDSFNNSGLLNRNFGDIAFVNHSERSKMMFVINSKHEPGQSTSILGPQPGEIIKKVFKSLETQAVDIVQIPILSSTNVRCTENNAIKYSVTIAEIIEQYFQETLNNSNIDYDLVLSIRKEDLKENSITIKSIIKFINELKPMYQIE